jgi:prolyl-tRNA editing enzyme YbaK/EbsC (Cys-tRNA(Pro) deacylase)
VFAVGDTSNKSAGQAVVALVSGDDQLDVAKLAAAAGTPHAWRVDAKAVRDATGYAVGGIPPLGHATELKVFADTRLRRFTEVWAAAGTPSHVFGVNVDALAVAAAATWADLATDPAPDVVSDATVRPNEVTGLAAPLSVSHPLPQGRDILGTVPLSVRPAQLSALPSVRARGIAFGSILLGGLLGGILTYAIMKVFTGKRSGATIGIWTVVGSVSIAFGTGVLAILALRAMGEWRGHNQSQDVSTVLGDSA